MHKLITHFPRALLYTLIIVGIHLLTVFVLDLRIEGWNGSTLRQIMRAYALPVSLIVLNHIIFFKDDLSKYSKVWFSANTIPGILLLVLFRITVDYSDFLYGYRFQLIALFPKLCILIQLVLLYVWKVERRNDQDIY